MGGEDDLEALPGTKLRSVSGGKTAHAAAMAPTIVEITTAVTVKNGHLSGNGL